MDRLDGLLLLCHQPHDPCPLTAEVTDALRVFVAENPKRAEQAQQFIAIEHHATTD